jgi:formamidopyrimidine-DNA glycosylase
LYQARIHPACPVPALSSDDLERLHHWIREIPLTAVKVNAMHGKFPDNWLFRWRWGKGKKQENRVKKAKEDGRIVDKDSEGESEGEEEEEELADVKDEKVTPKSKDFMALVSRLSVPDGY